MPWHLNRLNAFLSFAMNSLRKVVVQEKPSLPCRVSLEDADVGETIFLLGGEAHPNRVLALRRAPKSI